MRFRLLLASTAALLLWGCDQSTASANSGTNDETSTFYLQSGRVAARAAVTIFAAGRADSLPTTKTYTDVNGHLNFPSVPKGYYSVFVRDTSGQAAFVDSIFSDGAGAVVPSDTLHPTGSVEGRVAVQPQDDPRIAWVALLGAGLFANVDDSGKFSISGIPEGRYTLLATTNQSQYTSTFVPAPVWMDSTTNLGTIQLVYTGVPVVSGITGTWDSLGGIVHLSWDTTGESKATGYRIYKGNSNDPTSGALVAFVNAGTSTWADTVFPRADSMAGMTEYVRYQVTAVGLNGAESARWNSWSDTVRSPDLVAQLPATWTLVSSNIPCASCRLDTLPGSLLLIDNGALYSGTAGLLVSKDGTSWNQIRSEPDSDGFSSFTGGLPDGVVYQGKFWWIHPKPSSRLIYIPDSTSYQHLQFALTDSLQVLSIDAAGQMDSTTIATSSDSVSAYHLVVDSTGLVLLEGMVWYASAVSEYGMKVETRRLHVDGNWNLGQWATWFAQWPWLLPPSFNLEYAERIVSPKGRSTVYLASYPGTYLDQDAQMLETTGNPYGGFSGFMYYTTTPSAPRWHRVQGTPEDLGTMTSFQGAVWTTESDSLWKVTMP